MNALGSVTGRVGVAIEDAVLFYAKGGYAWANNKLSVTAPGLVASDTKVHSGYTIGGGIEYMFAPNWSAKAEYMFTHLDSQTYTLGGVSPSIPAPRNSTPSRSASTIISDKRPLRLCRPAGDGRSHASNVPSPGFPGLFVCASHDHRLAGSWLAQGGPLHCEIFSTRD